MTMKTNAGWLAKRNACKRCHSEPEHLGESRGYTGHVKCVERSSTGLRAISGFSKCGIISNFRKSGLDASGDVLQWENTRPSGLSLWDASLSYCNLRGSHILDLKEIIDVVTK